MAETRQLSGGDVMFIAGETERLYQHVCLLATLDTNDRPEFDFAHFRQHCVDRISMVPHFQWKLHQVPMGLDRPYWVEDEHFSFNHHIKRIALPSPGDDTILCEVIADLHSRHLDHTKPLWEIWFIEGLEGGRHAYLYKFHHSMMDGGGALQMIGLICDTEPDPAEPKEIDETISRARAGQMPSLPQQSARAWQHMAKLPFDAARSAYDMVGSKIREQFKWPREPRADRPQVPSTSFNGEISSERGCAFACLPLDDMKIIKNHFDVSLNDVLLALVGSAVRYYLINHSELPELPLRTSVPVSVRNDSDEQISNQVTSTTMTLATDLDDPVARLQEISRDSKRAKARALHGSIGMVEVFQIMPPILVSAMMGSLPSEYAPQIMNANLFVSNMKGSETPIYIAGARMETMYPFSIVTAGMGINISCISYDGQMDVGIIVDPELVPDYAEIAGYLESALIDYKSLCSPADAR